GLVFLAVFAFGAPAPRAAAQSNPFYKGKTLTFLINYAPGGGTDTTARLIERHIGRFIPGTPRISFKYVPGGGATIGVNYLYRKSKPNGYVLGVFTGVVAMQATKAPGAKFDLNKMQWVTGVGEPEVYFVRADVAKSMKDLFKPGKKIIVPGYSRNNTKDISLNLVFDILEVPKENYKYVTGYKGSGPVSLAMRSGEVSFMGASLASYGGRWRSLADEGITTPPLFQNGLLKPDGTVIRDPRLADMPTLGEVYKQIHGKPHPAGQKWEAWKWTVGARSLIRSAMFPPGTPAEPVRILTEAFQALAKDKKFQADAKKVTRAKMIFMTGKDAKSMLPEVATINPQAKEYIEKLMGIKF
ncbi:MAG: Bug family tripartite tricarboxylate transporter substrate binding protein, partial [Candidatus Binatia bacterium]